MSFMATTCSLQATREYCQGVEPAAILTEQETQQGADRGSSRAPFLPTPEDYYSGL